MNKRWKTWSPFQSKDVREICAHLTDDEMKMFVERSMYFGAMIGVLFAFPMSITSVGAFMIISMYGGSIAFALIPCVWFLVSLAFVPRILKKNKELL